MPVTIEEVRAELEPEEPNYDRAAKTLGADALPHLERLIVGDHPMLASKAAYLAGLIGTERSVPAIERAARSGDARVRIAAAAAVQHLPAESASDVLLSLIDDPDVGVQKTALRSVPDAPSAVLRARVEGLSAGKTDNVIRDLSRAIVARSAVDSSASVASFAAVQRAGKKRAAKKSAAKKSAAKKRAATKSKKR